jgi:hypothetical protein
MPSSPVVEVKFIVDTKEVSRAVYLILAEFYLDGKLLAINSSYILISDEEQLSALKNQEKASSVTDGIDTLEMFSKMDSLLIQRQELTSGGNQEGLVGFEPKVVNYRVQILASNKILPNVKRLLLSMNINEPFKNHYDGECYRYTVGIFKTKGECVEYLRFVQYKGFADAFIVKYIGDGPAKGD